MAPPKSLLEKQSILTLERIYTEVHPLMVSPHYWSGNGRHVDFETSQPLRTIFTKQEHIGRTSFSNIIKTTCKGVTIAQKQLHPLPERDTAGFLKAVQRLEKIEHRHLILTLGSFTEKTNLLGMLMYPCAPCDLGFILDEVDRDGDQLIDLGRQLGIVSDRNSEDKRTSFVNYLQQLYGCLTNAVEYLHSQGVCIKELKPEHILLCPDGPCLTDFGLLKPTTNNGIGIDIYRYYAPEASVEVEPTLASDIFSLACCFLEICTVVNGLPLQDLRRTAIPRHFVNLGRSAYKHNLRELYSWIEQLRALRQPYLHSPPYTELDLLELMLREDASSRPVARRVVFYLDCLEGEDNASTGGCIYHRTCCRPRRFETTERIEAKRLLKETLTGLERPTPDANRHVPNQFPTRDFPNALPIRDVPDPSPNRDIPEPSPSNDIPNPMLTNNAPNPPPINDSTEKSIPERPKVRCPVSVCPADSILLNGFYDHLQDSHRFWLSGAHKYKCPSCPDVPRVSLDNFVEHIEKSHAGLDKVAAFNSGTYEALCTNAGFRDKWKLVVPSRGIEKA